MRRARLTIAWMTVCLAGCGGGSGAPTPPADANVVGLPATLQAPSTTVQYGVSSAVGSFNMGTGVTASGIAAADTGSTVTVTTDTSGHVSSLALNITNGGSTFQQTFAGSQFLSFSGALTLAALATAIEQVATATAGTTGIVLQASGQSLDYSAFGAWLSNDGAGNFRVGNFATGVETPAASMPTTGSASYSGQTTGVGASGTSVFAVSGNAAISANFGTATVTTTFNGLTTQNLQTSVIGSLPTQTGTGPITGNQYSAAISGGGLSGTSNGTFYGPSAQETAGVWRSSGGGTTVVGSFGARQ